MNTPRLPVARTPGGYRIAMVCLGNICRSPMADVVLAARVAADPALSDRVVVTSCGTADWHVGKPMDHRSATALSGAGYDPSRHRARHHDATWTTSHDLLLAMDRQNLADILPTVPADEVAAGRVRLFRDFDPAGAGEVPDPYYGGDDGFADVLAMVERTSDVLAALLARELE